MLQYQCDGCGKNLPRHALRYTVTVDVRAAYEKQEIGLADLVRNHKEEILALIESMESKSPKEVEESVYKNIQLDLCPSCQKAYISNPLGFHPEQAPISETLDIDTFLRSLGYGEEGHSSDTE
ncbi:MAG: hypothetical protein COA73_09900 [Candidatus Hydrogenedentota bacterium]|nr:MAG: hypothetical protein COA73_11545 [Candidatus Hydrogenedentota bacterium]PCJ58571.1 MAG: hypothetical protein COA73_09900 [Candidatus Hydrogenedentota bacterium]